MKITCIIPAWNEEATIGKVVKEVGPLVSEVVVVDDCSSDRTSELARAAGALVLRHPINRGQGAALQTGNDYALSTGADIIVHFDADDQFLASEIPDLVAPLERGEADICFGSRFLGKEPNWPPLKKYLVMPLAKLFMRLVMGTKLSDPQNGFRALNRLAASQIQIINRGMAHASEIQAKAVSGRLRITEVPVTVIYHEYGQRLGGALRVIKDLFINKLTATPDKR